MVEQILLYIIEGVETYSRLVAFSEWDNMQTRDQRFDIKFSNENNTNYRIELLRNVSAF